MKRKQVSIAAELRKAIGQAEKAGKTRGAMAAEAGIPRSQFNRIADGENLPRIDTAERILKAIGLRLTIST